MPASFLRLLHPRNIPDRTRWCPPARLTRPRPRLKQLFELPDRGMDLTDMRVALTGATGFLGSHLARALIARGATVRGVVRRPERGKWLTELGVALHAADLADPVALTRAFEGCDAVIANAALSIRGTAPYQTFLDANRRGAIHQAQAAADARVNRLIHISTVAVYRPGLNQVNGHDRLLLDGPRLTWAYAVTNWRYALSKAHGERAIWQISRDHGLDTTVLRPGPIYGSGDRKLTASYAALMARRWLPAPTLRLPHVHARDVADAACGAVAAARS